MTDRTSIEQFAFGPTAYGHMYSSTAIALPPIKCLALGAVSNTLVDTRRQASHATSHLL